MKRDEVENEEIKIAIKFWTNDKAEGEDDITVERQKSTNDPDLIHQFKPSFIRFCRKRQCQSNGERQSP